MFQFTLRSLFALFIFFTVFTAQADSGPGNGTDRVKVLFAEAQNQLNSLVPSVTDEQIQDFEMDPDCRNWLLQKVGTSSHWDQLKSYLSKMRLAFQEAPCEDAQGRKSSICFYNENPQDPYVLVSLQENRQTTSAQAMAMLVHEAGHFVGEMDHLFLDRVGVQIVRALLEPKSFSVTVSSTELVGNIFAAKEECESGKSSQALHLWQQAQMQLTELCQLHHKSCDFKKAILSYQGHLEQKPGVGFTMEVTCELKALLPL